VDGLKVPGVAVFVAAAIGMCGCKAPVGGAKSGDERIAQVNLITVPVALDMDGVPGVDGIALKLYGNNPKEPKAIRIREGTIEFLLFDGTFHGRTSPPPVLRTFTFAASQLRLHEFRSTLGYGYDFTLRWGTNIPTQRIMSVGARYTGVDGRVVTSRPSSVTVLNK